MHYTKIGSLSLALLLITGCGAADDAGTPAAVAVEGTLGDQPVLAGLDTTALQERAARALRDDRMYSPAGRNAVEYYLALRDKAPAQPGVQSALVDLQPYVLIANEQAIVSGRLDEARRLTALLAKMDGAAPALPRLRQALAAAEAALAAEALQALQALQDDEALAPSTQQSQESAVVRLAGQEAEEARAVTATPSLEPLRPAGRASDADAATSPPAATAALAEVAPPRTAAAPVQAAPPAASATAAPMPRLLRQVAPKYPPIALGRRVEGSVEVSFTIEADGSVSGARAVASRPARIFDNAALTAVSQWRFEATGRSITTTRTLNFTLDGNG